MEATLTELGRETAKVLRPVIQDGEKVTLTENGQSVAEIVPIEKINYTQACEDLIAIGPVAFLPRARFSTEASD